MVLEIFIAGFSTNRYVRSEIRNVIPIDSGSRTGKAITP